MKLAAPIAWIGLVAVACGAAAGEGPAEVALGGAAPWEGSGTMQATERLTGDDAGQVFAAANVAYENGDFETAARAYGELVAGGWGGHEVYYNLGNSLYRLGRTGACILALERARRLAPGSRSTRENLEFVSSRIVDRTDEPGEQGPLDALQEWHGRVSPLLATSLFLLAWVAFNTCLAAALFNQRRAWRRLATYLLAGLLAGVMLSGSILGLLVYRRDGVVHAVVLQARVDLLSVPGEGGVRLTTVHEGLKIRVLDARHEWLQVTLPNGFQGWLPRAAVGVV